MAEQDVKDFAKLVIRNHLEVAKASILSIKTYDFDLPQQAKDKLLAIYNDIKDALDQL